MREIDKVIPIEITEEKQVKKQSKFIGSTRKIKGLTLFEFNQNTKVMQPAKFRPLGIFISCGPDGFKTSTTSECVVNEDCLYIQALNKKNALKKVSS